MRIQKLSDSNVNVQWLQWNRCSFETPDPEEDQNATVHFLFNDWTFNIHQLRKIHPRATYSNSDLTYHYKPLEVNLSLFCETYSYIPQQEGIACNNYGYS